MPKNKGKGGNKRRRGKSAAPQTRALEFKEDGQEYGQVIKVLGNGHMLLRCFDGVERNGRIRGKMMKRMWVRLSDIVLVGLRDYQDSQCDIIHKYNDDEARMLVKNGQIPAHAIQDEKDKADNGPGGIIFEDDSEEEAEEVHGRGIGFQRDVSMPDLGSSSEDEEEEDAAAAGDVDIDDI
eukprot:m.353939 g.353939  ORF g.353939 m.353939 type:complete len:180 (+) comp16868_c0_seq1:453-992(+)